MSVARLDKLIWALIYGGLLVAAVGLALRGSEAVLGWSLVGGGGVLAVVGACLVVVRSRMPAGDGS
jgi:hypothetical protein